MEWDCRSFFLKTTALLCGVGSNLERPKSSREWGPQLLVFGTKLPGKEKWVAIGWYPPSFQLGPPVHLDGGRSSVGWPASLALFLLFPPLFKRHLPRDRADENVVSCMSWEEHYVTDNVHACHVQTLFKVSRTLKWIGGWVGGCLCWSILAQSAYLLEVWLLVL